MVKKENGKWRMCVDFMDLNNACPKDSFPLPRINRPVDSIVEHKLLTFMDDFTDLNNAYLKENFPLPRINRLVDSTAEHKLLTFMDAFSRYNQIQMDEEDQEKIAFIASQGLYCYKVMPFGLKNARATYQRLVNQMFSKQIGRNVEVYIDDMLVKSKEEEDHLDDLRETFNTLRQYNMKLNPSKCAFGVSSGKFLRFMVS